MRRAAVLVPFLWIAGCGSSTPPQPFSDLLEEFVHTVLSFSPAMATAAGYHVHNGIPLDDQLDSFSPESLGRQRQFYRSILDRLADAEKRGGLDVQDLADAELIRDFAALQQLELDVLQRHKHDPTLYVELAGAALFNPLVLEYAPLEKRFQHINLRLRQFPRLFGEARANLTDAPELSLRVAIQENDGNRDLLVRTLAQAVPVSERGAYQRASAEALRAIDSFTEYLQTELSRKRSDFRLGKANYGLKFAAALGTGLAPEQVLAEAESELERTRARMHELALATYAQSFPGRTPPQDRDALTRQVLDKIASRHATPATYFDDARRDLEEARSFVRQKGFVALPPNDNLKVIPTPEFMRGVYSVGGFNAAPPLEPKLGAFYWLTPIPDTWEPARAESKLREYNFHGLKILTIHEAIPGHYLQFEYANTVEPPRRRLLRALFGNGPYVEGWAVYATELMIEHGFQAGDPGFALTFHKQMLRVISNTILDIRLHTKGMTGEQAMDLMLNKTFQEKEEAEGKLQRAMLSSAQLPTYFVGWREWKRIREEERRRLGEDFREAGFHHAALGAGAVTMSSLRRILAAPAAPK